MKQWIECNECGTITHDEWYVDNLICKQCSSSNVGYDYDD